jgi:ubiquinone/menaquinone biosynthesis C-methylase UbiE
MLDRYPDGKVLDAACGTGRWAKSFSERGHSAIGVDESSAMLALARVKVPDVEFLQRVAATIGIASVLATRRR